MATLPLAPCVTETTARPPSMSVSLASTLIVTGAVPMVLPLSLAATGASHTPFTVMVKVQAAEVSLPPKAVPPSSCATTVTVATPLALGAGV